ncbi:MAG: HAMP domain-containing histidine kinase [Sphingobacterium sp.]|jgi:signal transduction histidine kinase|nr:HAMP domain-containing histidine kinase [Sphingobacterium sp.]
MNYIQRYWNILKDIGTRPDMSYVNLKRIQMVNLIAILCLLPTLCFFILNIIDQRYLLSMINLSNTICSISVLFLQYDGKHNFAKAMLLISNFLFFLLGAMLFKNGGEYFLLCTLIASMLLYDDRRIHIVFCLATTASIALLYFSPAIVPVAQRVPKLRLIFNISNALAFIVIAVNFFLQIIYNNMKKIEEQRRKLESMNRDKEKIFSIVAHDIKSPFANLESLVLMLRDQILNNNIAKEYIHQLYQQIVHQNQALDDFLQWGSSSMRGITSPATLIVIEPLIRDIMLLFADQIQTKQLKIEIEIPQGTYILANRDHMIIILRNLISNAIKFSYVAGKISIYCSKDETYTRIHIQDEGIGINPSKSALLFNVIQRKSFGTEDEPGSGLGLVLCKDLIERNKGVVDIQSIPNKGSIFTVGLPSHTVKDNPLKKEAQTCC